MKKIPNAFYDHIDAKRTLREIMMLRHFDHKNVIAIRDVVPPPLLSEFTDVYIATVLMDTDIHQIIRSNQSLSEEHCRVLSALHLFRSLVSDSSAFRVFSAVLLVSDSSRIEICDFGLDPTSESEFMTEYVVTGWYRAPELLLNSSDYTSAFDVWYVGCIFMEIMNRNPLFPGKDQMHQLRLLTELLGTPTESNLGFVKNEDARRYIRQMNPLPRQPLAQAFPHIHPLAIDLVDRMLTFDPMKRITEPFSSDFERQPLGEEQIKDMIYAEVSALNPGIKMAPKKCYEVYKTRDKLRRRM